MRANIVDMDGSATAYISAYRLRYVSDYNSVLQKGLTKVGNVWYIISDSMYKEWFEIYKG